MIISHKYKFIFIKTRKTASSSLEKILTQYLGDTDISTGSKNDGTPQLNINNLINPHVSGKWIKKNFNLEWEEYYKFTIVRNPWDFLVSLYTFHTSTGIDKHLFEGNFNTWLLNTNLQQWNDWNKFTINNQIVVDKIFKYEDLHSSLKNQTRIPYEGQLLKVKVKGNFRKDQDYKKYYDSKTIDLVSLSFSNIIQTFNYSFE